MRLGFGDSGEGGASLGRVLLMAPLRFGQSKEHVPADGTRALKGFLASRLMAPALPWNADVPSKLQALASISLVVFVVFLYFVVGTPYIIYYREVISR